MNFQPEPLENGRTNYRASVGSVRVVIYEEPLAVWHLRLYLGSSPTCIWTVDLPYIWLTLEEVMAEAEQLTQAAISITIVDANQVLSLLEAGPRGEGKSALERVLEEDAL